MKCWNCQGVLPPEDGELCPHCRAIRRPIHRSRSEYLGAMVAVAAGAIGYYYAEWTGAIFGLSAGIPLGCIVALVWSRPPTVG